MRLIAHRGNIAGPDRELENDPAYVDEAIAQGYDVEVDLSQSIDGRLFLGHDRMDYEIDNEWLVERRAWLWVHCKNVRALETALRLGMNCFSHDTDYAAVTFWGNRIRHLCTRSS